jgi:peptidoglycan/LPS O-acetylase OafA/YrhL
MLVINIMVEKQWAGQWPALAVATAISLILAWLSWHLIEEPALQLKNYNARSHKATGPA